MKRFLTTLTLTFLLLTGYSQMTFVPDDNFEQKLIDMELDEVLDDSVLTASIDTVVGLYLNGLIIESLEGIEGFLSLELLECKNNILTALDLSSNTNLKYLSCELNYIDVLNLEGIESLEILFCDNNELTSLDLTEHIGLEYLLCGRNPLDFLDISSNDSLIYIEFRVVPSIIEMDLSDKPNLREVYCDYNENLLYLNLANGMPDSFNILHAWETPNLTCLEVDDPLISETNWNNYFTEGEAKTFSTFCELSLTEESIEILVQIYPIPSEYYINIAVNDALLNYKLVDIAGKVMHGGKLALGENNIRVQDLSRGVYFVQIDGQNYHSTHKTIIK